MKKDGNPEGGKWSFDEDNRIKQNDIIATSGFGAGLSWGAALIKWG